MQSARKTKFVHAIISILVMIALIFVSIVIFDLDPQIPLIFGCFAAGVIAAVIGYSWTEILDGILSGIAQSLEAILILILIGMLVGVWIASGTVPTMIYYGLQLISARYFLFTSALVCGIMSYTIGAWGTVGTIGLAFMGVGIALGVPVPVVAGSIISGCYFGEVVSPLSDVTNLTAAVVGQNVFSITKKVMPLAVVAFSISELLYFFIGLQSSGLNEETITSNIQPLLTGLSELFNISLLSLLPLAIIIICIIIKFPAIPSMLIGIISAMIYAMLFQNLSIRDLFIVCSSGYISESGQTTLDSLLTAGGIGSMMETISIVIIAMAFGGLMQHTGQMAALTVPILKRVRGVAGLNVLTVSVCVAMNAVLSDQYLGISVPGQMFAEEYDKRGCSKLELSQALLCGGAVTSPLIPWNTCGIYCMTILGISAREYLPYVFLGMILPLINIAEKILHGYMIKHIKAKA